MDEVAELLEQRHALAECNDGARVSPSISSALGVVMRCNRVRGDPHRARHFERSSLAQAAFRGAVHSGLLQACWYHAVTNVSSS